MKGLDISFPGTKKSIAHLWAEISAFETIWGKSFDKLYLDEMHYGEYQLLKVMGSMIRYPN